jgi:predicted phage-related endonuclease
MPEITIQNEDHWHALRLTHGGSSEAAALFDYGYEGMPSLWSLWALKSGKMESDLDDDNLPDRVWFGRELEDIIARAVARKHGWSLIGNAAYVVHADAELKMGATVDRWVIDHEDGRGIVECKNRDYLEWVQNYTADDAAMRDKIQLAHQLSCCEEATWGAIAVLIGGNTLKVYRYSRDDIKEIIDSVEAGWRNLWRMVKEGSEPELTGSEIPAWLRVHFDDLGTKTEVLSVNDKTFDDNVEGYLQASKARKQWDKAEKDFKASILQVFEDHGRLRSNRWIGKATFSKVAESVVTLPAETKTDLGIMRDMLLKSDLDFKATSAMILEDVINWHQVTRKESIRTTLKFEEDPVATSPDATPEALAAGMAAQKPLEG